MLKVNYLLEDVKDTIWNIALVLNIRAANWLLNNFAKKHYCEYLFIRNNSIVFDMMNGVQELLDDDVLTDWGWNGEWALKHARKVLDDDLKRSFDAV